MKRRITALILCVSLFVCLCFPAVASAVGAVPGDVNGDSAVNMKDVLALRRFIGGLDSSLAGDGDVNLDDAVNMKDVLLLRLFLAGIETTLPTRLVTETAASTATAFAPETTAEPVTETATETGTKTEQETATVTGFVTETATNTANPSETTSETPDETTRTTHTTKGRTTWATKYPIDHDAPRINFIDQSTTLGVWWWHIDDVKDDALYSRYMTLLEENQVTEIYFYCSTWMTTPDNRAKVHTFVQQAMERGMRVAVLYDNQSVVKQGNNPFASIVKLYLQYKEEYPEDDLYGLHCDIEPQAADRVNETTWRAWVQGYASYFIPQIAAARKQGVCVELDLGCGWWVYGADLEYTGTEMHPYDGTTMNLFDIIAHNVDTMCMMAYRDTASEILNMGAGGRAAADNAGCKIVYGVETGDDGEGAHVDFYADSKEIMYTELSRLSTRLEAKPPVGGYGFAIHYMRMWDALRDTMDVE